MEPLARLGSLIEIIANSDAGVDAHMNARSAIGGVLFLCAASDVEKAFGVLRDWMDRTEPNSGLSIVLISSLAYVLKFTDFRARDKLARSAMPLFLKHAVSCDAGHISDMLIFLTRGGTKTLPYPDEFVSGLLEVSDGESLVGRPIGLLVTAKPVECSECVWKYISQRTVDDKILSFIGAIIMGGDLLPPADEGMIERVVEAVKVGCSSGRFAVAERALAVCKWLIAHRKLSPETMNLAYDVLSLQVLAVRCWAKYAVWGDLSKLPKFETTEEAALRSAYLAVIVNATKNEKFGFDAIDIPHWLWNDIRIEFGGAEGVTNALMHDLVLEEWGLCAEIFHILPEWFFVHGLRFRCGNAPVSQRVIKIMEYIPKSVIDVYFQDFQKFMLFHLDKFPTNAPNIAECLRNLAFFMVGKFDDLARIVIANIDFYSEQGMAAYLTVLNVLLNYDIDIEPILDVFDTLWESIPLMNLSLSLAQPILRFISAVAPLLAEKAEPLFNLAMAVIFAAYQGSSIRMFKGFPNSIAFFRACQRFCTGTTDIVVSPQYRPADSSVMSCIALRLLFHLPKTSYDALPLLFEKFPLLLTQFPGETLSLAVYYSDFLLSSRHRSALDTFCTSISEQMVFRDDVTFTVLAYALKLLVKDCMPIDGIESWRSGLYDLPDDIDSVRLILSTDPVLFPLITRKASLYSILVESWAPAVDTGMISMISLSIDNDNANPNALRCQRALLSYLGADQPEYAGYDSWIKRDFTEKRAVSPMVFDDTKTYKDCDEAFSDFCRCYPVRERVCTTEVISDVLRRYRSVVECSETVKFMTSCNAQKIIDTRKDSFWLIRYLWKNKVPFVFPADTSNLKSIELATRNGWKVASTIVAKGSIVERPAADDPIIILSQRVPMEVLRRVVQPPRLSICNSIVDRLTMMVDEKCVGVLEDIDPVKLTRMLQVFDGRNPVLTESLFALLLSLVPYRGAGDCFTIVCKCATEFILNHRTNVSRRSYFHLLASMGDIQAKLTLKDEKSSHVLMFIDGMVAVLAGADPCDI